MEYYLMEEEPGNRIPYGINKDRAVVVSASSWLWILMNLWAAFCFRKAISSR